MYLNICKTAKNNYYMRKFENAGNNMRENWKNIREVMGTPAVKEFRIKGTAHITENTNAPK